MRRILLAIVLFTLACALSGCPIFTRDDSERPPVAPTQEGAGEE